MSAPTTHIEGEARPRRRWPWITAAAVVVVAVAATVVAVTSTARPQADPAAVAGGAPVRGGTLQFAMIDFQRSPDVHAGSNYAESIIGNNVTDKLTWQDPETGEITPWLATSWEFNDALTEFTFHLRQDVTFSDGTPFDAAAVKANFDQYARGDERLGIKPNGAVYLPGYVETATPQPYTAVVRFSRPVASFLQASSFTANNQPGFLSLSTLARSAEERTDPRNVIGTGPFVYESWQSQVSTVLVRRQGYHWAPPALNHEGEAYLDRIVFNVVPEGSVRTGSLTSGTVDAILDVQPTDEAPLAAQGYPVVSGQVGGADIRFDFNLSLAPTNDIAVRKAIQLGWNRRAIEQTVLSDSYRISTSVLADNVEGYVDHSATALRFDQAEARRLLDAAGWVPGPDGIRVRDGVPLVVKLLGINNLVVNKPAYESIQQDLRGVGIDLQLTVVPIPDSTALRANALTDWNIVAGNRSRNDASVLNLTYNPALDNTAFLPADLPGRDRLVEGLSRLETTLDPQQRREYAKAAQDLVLDEFALTNPVYTPSQVIAHAPTVHGIVFDAQARNHFVNTWKSPV
ncbi:ABC transporter substrate-binding protein [Pseudonocardia aurantiaca]|uniref:ABC transporter substrate-binding protein n=1 Tax=Pseudonocardia aurantiaca TaxID=75290 RepID=A0ABW4FT56_9PSEU